VLKSIRSLLTPETLPLFDAQMSFAESIIESSKQAAATDRYPM
jgi:hypothetical protein